MKKFKKVLLIAAFALVGCAAVASLATIPTMNRMWSHAAAYDSLSNANKDTMTSKKITTSPNRVTVNALAIKQTGTVNCFAVLYSGNDGVHFDPHFKTLNAANASMDTFTLADVTTDQHKVWDVTNTYSSVATGLPIRQYFRIIWYPTGTQKLYLQGSTWTFN